MIYAVPAMAADQVKVFVNGEEVAFDVPPFIRNSRVLVPVRKIAETLAFTVDWVEQRGQIIIEGRLNSKTIVLDVREGYAESDGRRLVLDAPPVIRDGRTFIPLRFISEALGATVRWYDEDREVFITSNLLYAAVGEHLFWLNKSDSGLFYAYGSGVPQKLADLEWQPQWESLVDFSAQATPAGNILLTVREVYGEPKIFEGTYYIYFNLTNSTLHEASVTYTHRANSNPVFYQDKVVLTDGKNVFVIENESGKVVGSYDLVTMTGEEDVYLLEGIGGNYLLVRPSKTGLLTLLYLDTGEKVLLYKELLDEMQQEYAEMNDIPYRGDWLKLVDQNENFLYFRNEATVFGEDDTIYVYELKSKTKVF